jgi:mannose/fructose-specific phosphotransferase system component IIA/MFS family permease
MSVARTAVAMFFAFAFAYFLSALLRAVTATLASAFSAELGLSAADLGLLAGAYFLGFALTQLPLGHALDRFGPRRVLLALLSVAAAACMAFAVGQSLVALWLARAMIGVGVSACLMAPLTAYRHRLGEFAQLRANSWMLMTGSLGMLASTLPVQWLLPAIGWRGLFWLVAALLLVSMAAIAWLVPRDRSTAPAPLPALSVLQGYGAICRHPYFMRLMPLAFVLYGGLIAVQSLWAGPWLTVVAGRTPEQAAEGLFFINLAMLVAFLSWGLAMPPLRQRGFTVNGLMAFGVALSLGLLALAVALGPAAGAWMWAAWCVSCTFVSLSQPAVAQVFPQAQAGRALSAFNLVIFSGVFCVQWGIGLVVDALMSHGWAQPDALRAAFALFGLCAAAAYAWFLLRHASADNQKPTDRPVMARLLIIAHAPLASALAQVASHTFPDCAAQLRALDVPPEMTPEEVQLRAAALLPSADSQDTLILTDVFGATPCNAAQRLADGVHVRVVAGVNVPMLWRTLCYANEPLDALVTRAMAGATQGVMQASATPPQQQARGA